MGVKKIKVWLYYICMLLFFGVLTYFLINKGWQIEKQVDNTHCATSGLDMFMNSLIVHIGEPVALLLLQIISILVVSRIFSYIFARFGQPTVIGEILAGIVLGPSLFGCFFPHAFNFLFATNSLGNINILSQIGLILFMFTIGMDLNLRVLKGKMSETYVISHSGIVIPFFLGMFLAYFIYREFATGHTTFLSFALFIGTSMSVTAFPVLARIIQEKGKTTSNLGTISLASAAIDDVTAWCLLAAVIAIAKTGSLTGSLYTIGMAVVYIAIMLFVIKPFMKRLGDIYKTREVINKSVVAFVFLILLCSALVTQLIGIHPLFGAFLAGVVMPPLPNFRKLIIEKIEDVSVTLLLPLFFVFTGLRTQIGLLDTPHLWWVCVFVILIATVGKFAGCAFSARFFGESWRDSLSIGVLMNTRGLMELIVLNIGYEMGILSPAIFAILVIMALVTTFMTTPILSLIEKVFPERNIKEELQIRKSLGIFKALVACGNPENGKPLLNVAKTVLEGSKNSLSVTVLHITAGTDINPIHGEEFSVDSFKGVKAEAENLKIPIQTEYKVTDNIEHGIVHIVNGENYDFLLVGVGVRLPGTFVYRKDFFYPGSLIKDKTRYFIENSKSSVGVFVNRNFVKITSTVILLHSAKDLFLLRYARRLLHNNIDVTINIVDLSHLIKIDDEMIKSFTELKDEFPHSVKLSNYANFSAPSLSDYSFMLISYQAWNILSVSNTKELEYIPSTLIINKKRSRFHDDLEKEF